MAPVPMSFYVPRANLLGLALAHGLKGRTVSSLSYSDVLTLADFLQSAGLISTTEAGLCVQYRAHLYRVVQVAWAKYRKALGDIHVELATPGTKR